MRLNLILLTTLVAVGLTVLFLEQPFAERSRKYAEYHLLFPDFEPRKVREVQIRRGEGEVTLGHTPSGWVVRDLYDYPAEHSKLQEVVGRVMRWRDNLFVGRSAAKFSKMAVDEETGTAVTIRDAAGEILAEFHLGRIGFEVGLGGKIDPDQVTFYLRPLPGDDVYLVNEFLLGTFSFQPENWIRRRLFPDVRDDRVKLVLRDGEETLVIERVGGEWKVEGPAPPVDPDRAGRRVEAFGSLTPADIADPSAPLETYGLASPRKTATVTLRDGRVLQLLVGRKKDDSTTYGMVQGSPFPLEILQGHLDRIFGEAR